MKKHQPILPATMMSKEKRDWWAAPWRRPTPGLQQPRMAVLHFVMNTTPRETAPAESIAFGYLRNDKLHDREPAALLRAIAAIDPNFFEGFPQKLGTSADRVLAFALSDAIRAFYRHGLHAFGIPGRRKVDDDDDDPSPPLGGL